MRERASHRDCSSIDEIERDIRAGIDGDRTRDINERLAIGDPSCASPFFPLANDIKIKEHLGSILRTPTSTWLVRGRRYLVRLRG